jgi:hypothetical protein
MKLTEQAINGINNRKSILALALALGFKEQWTTRIVQTNKENGPLTTAKALQVIKEETGLEYSQILEEIPVES